MDAFAPTSSTIQKPTTATAYLGTGIALADVLGLVVQLPGAAIDEFGEAQGAAEPALLMHDFAMPRQHDLRGKETRRRTIGTLITKTLMIALPAQWTNRTKISRSITFHDGIELDRVHHSKFGSSMIRQEIHFKRFNQEVRLDPHD